MYMNCSIKYYNVPCISYSYKMTVLLCSGCMLTFEEVTSHTFSSLQSSFHHCCDMHRALQVATDRFRTGLSSLLVGTDGVFQRRPAEVRAFIVLNLVIIFY